MTQVFVIQTDYWVLTIALCTYFILAGHKRTADWVEDHKWVVYSVPWLLSCTWAAVGLGVAGYGNIGACKSAPAVLPRYVCGALIA
jgi:hypothetical protein